MYCRVVLGECPLLVLVALVRGVGVPLSTRDKCAVCSGLSLAGNLEAEVAALKLLKL